ncbi:hypothetical protein LMG28138_06010 [Pararobbsia alpina]|uniref:Uncharacterized protein n=1 Tax=Pararobbsia alpina TaxID=621374 RepID=A0A6S7BQP0_9BURK|nr:hypothetical protein LMG28138_06010 [Pararobbsia alpina]
MMIAAGTVAVDRRGGSGRLQRHVAAGRDRAAAVQLKMGARRAQVLADRDRGRPAYLHAAARHVHEMRVGHTVRAMHNLGFARLLHAQGPVAAHIGRERTADVQRACVLLEVAACLDRCIVCHVDASLRAERPRDSLLAVRAHLTHCLDGGIQNQIAARIEIQVARLERRRRQVHVARRRERHLTAALQRAVGTVDTVARDRQRVRCVDRAAVRHGRVLQIDVRRGDHGTVAHVLLTRLCQIDDRHEHGLSVHDLRLHDHDVARQLRDLIGRQPGARRKIERSRKRRARGHQGLELVLGAGVVRQDRLPGQRQDLVLNKPLLVEAVSQAQLDLARIHPHLLEVVVARQPLPHAGEGRIRLDQVGCVRRASDTEQSARRQCDMTQHVDRHRAGNDRIAGIEPAWQRHLTDDRCRKRRHRRMARGIARDIVDRDPRAADRTVRRERRFVARQGIGANVGRCLTPGTRSRARTVAAE